MSEEKEVNASQQNSSEAKPVTPEQSEPVSEQEKTEHHPVKQSSGSTASFLATLIALAAVGGSFYLWQQQKVMRNDLTALDGSINRLVEAVEQRNNQQSERIEQLAQHQHQQTDQKLAHLEAQVLELRGRLSQERRDWVLAEAEYLLRVAKHRLALENDPQTAIAALNQAAQKLTQLQHPSLQAVTQQLHQDIEALNAISLPDTAIISADLASLSAELTQWPFSSSTHNREAIPSGENPPVGGKKEESGLGQMLDQIWEDIKGLVSIRRSDEVSRPLMDTEQRYFLQQNLRLKLESARLALISRQNQPYHDSLSDAKSWLQHYYDTSATSVKDAISTIERLDTINLAPVMPSLEQAMQLLQQAIMEIRSQQATQDIPGQETRPQAETESPEATVRPEADTFTAPETAVIQPSPSVESPEDTGTAESASTEQNATLAPVTEGASPQGENGKIPTPAPPSQIAPTEPSPESSSTPPAPSEQTPEDVPTPPQGIAL